jgi:hypothetical protein
MARARKLKSGAKAHDFTHEERAKGGRARAEKLRERREAAEEKLEGVVDEAIECLVAEMRAKGPDRTRAAVHILDRVLGKSTQRLEGKLELRRADLLDEAKEQPPRVRQPSASKPRPARRANRAPCAGDRERGRGQRGRLARPGGAAPSGPAI